MKKGFRMLSALLAAAVISGIVPVYAAPTASPTPTTAVDAVTSATNTRKVTVDETPAPSATPEFKLGEVPTATPDTTATPAATATAAPSATPTAAPTAAPTIDPAIDMAQNPHMYSDKLTLDIDIAPHQVVIDSVARFNLFNAKGELAATAEAWIGGETRNVHLEFNVPTYKLGEKFTLGFVDGFRALTYYTTTITPQNHFELETYCVTNADGTYTQGNSFAMSADPNFDRGINFYYKGVQATLYPRGRLLDGIAMISAYDLSKAMGLFYKYDEKYNSVVLSCGSKQMIFNIGTEYTTVFGNDINISHAPLWLDGAVYVPVRDVLNAFECTIDLYQDPDHIDVIAGESPIIKQIREQERVNREGISSRTNYLVWVSKRDFTVKVYQGSQYNWECIRTAPCSIGAPGTPTITGQFEYQYMGGTWSYPNFYVYPTLVFYGGYALHSTLRAWGGGMYDDRVGMMLSHGCVRLHPADIDWIYATIPKGTRIYVTE